MGGTTEGHRGAPGDAGPTRHLLPSLEARLPLTAHCGARTIATIDVTVDGGANVVALFGQWGAIQLLLASLLWLLLLRYRGFVPLVLVVLLLEPLLRDVAGRLKPLETLGTAPGAALNWAVVPVLAAMLWWSLCSQREPEPGG